MQGPTRGAALGEGRMVEVDILVVEGDVHISCDFKTLGRKVFKVVID